MEKIAVILICAMAPAAIVAQDALPLSRTDRSILQSQEEAAVPPTGFKKEEHVSGDWGGTRDVVDPGGTGDIPDALVIGAQMGFTF
jgi:hypothetical protein